MFRIGRPQFAPWNFVRTRLSNYNRIALYLGATVGKQVKRDDCQVKTSGSFLNQMNRAGDSVIELRSCFVLLCCVDLYCMKTKD